MSERFRGNGQTDFMIDFQRIGRMIRKARINLNMTQEQLSEYTRKVAEALGRFMS